MIGLIFGIAGLILSIVSLTLSIMAYKNNKKKNRENW